MKNLLIDLYLIGGGYCGIFVFPYRLGESIPFILDAILFPIKVALWPITLLIGI